MDDAYSPAQDSQAAYNAMPNQGLTKQQMSPLNSMSQQQKAQMAAQMLMNGFKANQPPPMQGAAMGAPAPVPTQTLNAGQWVGQGGR